MTPLFIVVLKYNSGNHFSKNFKEFWGILFPLKKGENLSNFFNGSMVLLLWFLADSWP